MAASASTTLPRTILVTGANRGLGLTTAERLARAGHRLVLTARDDAKARATADRIEQARAGAVVAAHAVDLTSLAAVRELAARLVARGQPIDVLVHNAGMLFPAERRVLTEDGIEACLQVHAVAPMLLTRMLLPVLARPARVWALGSSLHAPGTHGAPVGFDHDDPNLDQHYHPERAYKNSKLALLWVAYALEPRLAARGVHMDVVCPGFVPTTAAVGAQGWFSRFMLRRIMPHMSFTTSLEDSADGLARLFGQTPLDEPGGRYFTRWAVGESSEQSRDRAQVQRFWRWACARAGVSEALEEGE